MVNNGSIFYLGMSAMSKMIEGTFNWVDMILTHLLARGWYDASAKYTFSLFMLPCLTGNSCNLGMVMVKVPMPMFFTGDKSG